MNNHCNGTLKNKRIRIDIRSLNCISRSRSYKQLQVCCQRRPLIGQPYFTTQAYCQAAKCESSLNDPDIAVNSCHSTGLHGLCQVCSTLFFDNDAASAFGPMEANHVVGLPLMSGNPRGRATSLGLSSSLTPSTLLSQSGVFCLPFLVMPGMSCTGKNTV